MKRLVPPEPSADLAQIALPKPAKIRPVWFRLCASKYSSPLFWSRKGIYRFDSPHARWGVCYAASSIRAAFQEIFADKIRSNKGIPWAEISDLCVWRIYAVQGLRTIELYGPTLSLIRATLQCFTSSYGLSQRWGAALIEHSADLEGIRYMGRRSGSECLALLGDEDNPRGFQGNLKFERAGLLIDWEEFWVCLDEMAVLVAGMPVPKPVPNQPFSESIFP